LDQAVHEYLADVQRTVPRTTLTDVILDHFLVGWEAREALPPGAWAELQRQAFLRKQSMGKTLAQLAVEGLSQGTIRFPPEPTRRRK
jgi:hypothetical protein